MAKSRASELNRERAMRGAYANKSLSRTPLEELIGPTGPITTREKLKTHDLLFFLFFLFSLYHLISPWIIKGETQPLRGNDN
jgi:hypothetical protein